MIDPLFRGKIPDFWQFFRDYAGLFGTIRDHGDYIDRPTRYSKMPPAIDIALLYNSFSLYNRHLTPNVRENNK